MTPARSEYEKMKKGGAALQLNSQTVIYAGLKVVSDQLVASLRNLGRFAS
jgi:hypothetical protein